MQKISEYIVSPYFLDQEMFGLLNLNLNKFAINKVEFSSKNQLENIATIHKALKTAALKILNNGNLPISIAGDCCSSIAMLAALQTFGKNPILIWLDAHGDFNNFETTPSGHLGGMPLAMINGIGTQFLMKNVAAKNLTSKEILLSDARDLDKGEKILLEKQAIKIVKSLTEFSSINFNGKDVYLHFDTDLLSAEIAPAQNYPVKGGPSLEELVGFFSSIKNSGNLVAVSVSSWNPKLDANKKTEEIFMKLLSIFE